MFIAKRWHSLSRTVKMKFISDLKDIKLKIMQKG